MTTISVTNRTLTSHVVTNTNDDEDELWGDVWKVGAEVSVGGFDWEVESVKFDLPDADYFGPRVPPGPDDVFTRLTFVLRRDRSGHR